MEPPNKLMKPIELLNFRYYFMIQNELAWIYGHSMDAIWSESLRMTEQDAP